MDAALGRNGAGKGKSERAVTAFLEVAAVSKRFGEAVAVDQVSITLERGEVLALLGPSGSGKTTVLRLLAGFETPDAGRILLAGDDLTAVPPARRQFGMVFQHYALFPHLDVAGNVGFGLKGQHAVAEKVARSLALVDLSGFEHRAVHELSGGQQQRVALARALATEPRVLLLDEPLSNLDPSLRERTRHELRQLIGRLAITTIFVTHEQEEAFDLGQRVAVLHQGRLEQIGSAEDLYERPTTLFVAGFVGRANVLRGASARALGGAVGEVAVVRPERVRFADGGIAGVVRERRYIGANALYLVETDNGDRLEVLADPAAAAVAARVHLEVTRFVTLPDPGGSR